MKRLICVILAVGSLCSLAGCQNGRLPRPDFPLEEEVVIAALEHTGLPGVISEDETYSNAEKHIAYALRDPTKTYDDTESKVLTLAISSAITKGERFLAVSFPSSPGEAARLPFVWEDWKQQIIFATLLYGGFEDEEELYRAFSNKDIPESEESYEWDAQIPGAYCRVSYSFKSNLARFDVIIYESKSLYQELHQEIMEGIEELEISPAESSN